MNESEIADEFYLVFVNCSENMRGTTSFDYWEILCLKLSRMDRAFLEQVYYLWKAC